MVAQNSDFQVDCPELSTLKNLGNKIGVVLFADKCEMCDDRIPDPAQVLGHFLWIVRNHVQVFPLGYGYMPDSIAHIP